MRTDLLALRIRSRVEERGLTLADEPLERLVAYWSLLSKWNQHVNLTGLRLDGAPAETVDRLVVEPLIAATRVGPDPLYLVRLRVRRRLAGDTHEDSVAIRHARDGGNARPEGFVSP